MTKKIFFFFLSFSLVLVPSLSAKQRSKGEILAEINTLISELNTLKQRRTQIMGILDQENTSELFSGEGEVTVENILSQPQVEEALDTLTPPDKETVRRGLNELEPRLSEEEVEIGVANLTRPDETENTAIESGMEVDNPEEVAANYFSDKSNLIDRLGTSEQLETGENALDINVIMQHENERYDAFTRMTVKEKEKALDIYLEESEHLQERIAGEEDETIRQGLEELLRNKQNHMDAAFQDTAISRFKALPEEERASTISTNLEEEKDLRKQISDAKHAGDLEKVRELELARQGVLQHLSQIGAHGPQSERIRELLVANTIAKKNFADAADSEADQSGWFFKDKSKEAEARIARTSYEEAIQNLNTFTAQSDRNLEERMTALQREAARNPGSADLTEQVEELRNQAVDNKIMRQMARVLDNGNKDRRMIEAQGRFDSTAASVRELGRYMQDLDLSGTAAAGVNTVTSIVGDGAGMIADSARTILGADTTGEKNRTRIVDRKNKAWGDLQTLRKLRESSTEKKQEIFDSFVHDAYPDIEDPLINKLAKMNHDPQFNRGSGGIYDIMEAQAKTKEERELVRVSRAANNIDVRIKEQEKHNNFLHGRDEHGSRLLSHVLSPQRWVNKMANAATGGDFEMQVEDTATKLERDKKVQEMIRRHREKLRQNGGRYTPELEKEREILAINAPEMGRIQLSKDIEKHNRERIALQDKIENAGNPEERRILQEELKKKKEDIRARVQWREWNILNQEAQNAGARGDEHERIEKLLEYNRKYNDKMAEGVVRVAREADKSKRRYTTIETAVNTTGDSVAIAAITGGISHGAQKIMSRVRMNQALGTGVSREVAEIYAKGAGTAQKMTAGQTLAKYWKQINPLEDFSRANIGRVAASELGADASEHMLADTLGRENARFVGQTLTPRLISGVSKLRQSNPGEMLTPKKKKQILAQALVDVQRKINSATDHQEIGRLREQKAMVIDEIKRARGIKIKTVSKEKESAEKLARRAAVEQMLESEAERKKTAEAVRELAEKRRQIVADETKTPEQKRRLVARQTRKTLRKLGTGAIDKVRALSGKEGVASQDVIEVMKARDDLVTHATVTIAKQQKANQAVIANGGGNPREGSDIDLTILHADTAVAVKIKRGAERILKSVGVDPSNLDAEIFANKSKRDRNRTDVAETQRDRMLTRNDVLQTNNKEAYLEGQTFLHDSYRKGVMIDIATGEEMTPKQKKDYFAQRNRQARDPAFRRGVQRAQALTGAMDQDTLKKFHAKPDAPTKGTKYDLRKRERIIKAREGGMEAFYKYHDAVDANGNPKYSYSEAIMLADFETSNLSKAEKTKMRAVYETAQRIKDGKPDVYEPVRKLLGGDTSDAKAKEFVLEEITKQDRRELQTLADMYVAGMLEAHRARNKAGNAAERAEMDSILRQQSESKNAMLWRLQKNNKGLSDVYEGAYQKALERAEANPKNRELLRQMRETELKAAIVGARITSAADYQVIREFTGMEEAMVQARQRYEMNSSDPNAADSYRSILGRYRQKEEEIRSILTTRKTR